MDLDLTDSRAVERFADEIPGIDLLINTVDSNGAGRIEDTPPTVFAGGLETCFLGPVRLTAALLRKGKIAGKIATILSVSPFEERPGWSCRAAGQSALWAFTRALRRTVGREMQVMEVVPAAWPAGIGRRSLRVGADSTEETLARRIVQAERSGKEIVAMPTKSEPAMWAGAATASVCEAAGVTNGHEQIGNHRFY
jgi:NAD(P)-dependent dehydrogenase (short-subunit alcohol dehydrogenase family)